MEHVLVAHNRYRIRGGEDRVFDAELSLLRAGGVHAFPYLQDNRDLSDAAMMSAALGNIWRVATYQNLRLSVRRVRARIVHFHNTFPRISPAAYYAAQVEGAAVVQTLHNFRLLCPGATFVRNGQACEECAQKQSLVPAVVHGCYRSRPATFAVASMLGLHRIAGTWRSKVDVYIALSEFARNKFIDGGLSADRIVLKPNFVSRDPGKGRGDGGFALFVGRLSEEKGIEVLTKAWAEVPGIPLKVVGEGPLKSLVDGCRIERIGMADEATVFSLMQQATVLILPSICYENCPMTVLEAFACGLPVIASNIGSIPEFVSHERTGLLFRAGDPHELAEKVRWVFDHPKQLREMRRAARHEYEEKYTAERNFRMLMDTYALALENARLRSTVN